MNYGPCFPPFSVAVMFVSLVRLKPGVGSSLPQNVGQLASEATERMRITPCPLSCMVMVDNAPNPTTRVDRARDWLRLTWPT